MVSFCERESLQEKRAKNLYENVLFLVRLKFKLRCVWSFFSIPNLSSATAAILSPCLNLANLLFTRFKANEGTREFHQLKSVFSAFWWSCFTKAVARLSCQEFLDTSCVCPFLWSKCAYWKLQSKMHPQRSQKVCDTIYSFQTMNFVVGFH